MLKTYFRLFFLAGISLSTLMACVSNKITVKPLSTQTTQQRTSQLQQLKQWKIHGKIAFIQKTPYKQDKRESASLLWQVDEENNNQTLNLNSYLGINVLSLSSTQGQHVIKVDSEEYRSDNLPQLIYSLTGLTLPTQALTFWLKGLPYQSSDKIIYDSETKFPLSMTSTYHNSAWQITYDKYKIFAQLPMATKFTIEKDGLLIKISITNWSFTNSAS